MKTIRLYLMLVLALVSTTMKPNRACAQKGPSSVPPSDEQWVEQTLARMTLAEKIGQMLVPGTAGVFRNEESEEYTEIKRNITEFHVGGYHVTRGDPAGVALLTNNIQQLARLPLLISADLEAGVGYQFSNATRLPFAMALGAAADPELAYLAGKITAEEGRALGIHVNFYPVVDVNNNPRNPIINIRSFGEDVRNVSLLARAYIRGAQENGQIATAKHFPGHGDVAVDSHMELPVLDISRARLESVELPPFRAAVEQGVGAVMSGHIYLSQVEAERGLPATLSRILLTGILREELGFQGVIYTDAMTMRGVAGHFKEDDATVRAIEAGADIILLPINTEVSFNAVKSAVESGRITPVRIEDSVRRVLRAKARLGVHRNRVADLGRLSQIVGSQQNRDLAQKMMDAAITLVRDEKKVLPLHPSDELRVLTINLLDRREGWREGLAGLTFNAEIVKRFPRSVSLQVDDQTSPGELALVKKAAALADAVLVNGFIRVAAYKGSVDMNEGQIALLKHLSGLSKPFVFTMFGSPYLLTSVPDLPSYILAYDTHPAAELAALRAIAGEMEFHGRMPVSLPGLYEVGHRVERQAWK